MRGAPGFKTWPDPVDGRWKWELLRWIGKETGITTLFETGTCEGVTPYELRNDFNPIYTIELHPGLYEVARQRLSPFPWIHRYFGSSKSQLRAILERDVRPGPVLFWLDAHGSGPHTADDGDPLPDELDAIFSLRPDALVVIDDMRGHSEFMNSYGQHVDGLSVEYRTGEIILHRIGAYEIPKFEE